MVIITTVIEDSELLEPYKIDELSAILILKNNDFYGIIKDNNL